MAKVTFEFDFYEEKDLIDDALNAYKWKVMVSELMNKHRSIVKHGSEEDDIKFSEMFREEMIRAMDEEGLSLY